MKEAYVYIMANHRYGAVYTGVSSNLIKRVYEHKNSTRQGFTYRYDCKLLVYYESLESIETAIKREKQIKAGSRNNKLRLIDSFNPEWKDLYTEIIRY